MGEFAAVPEQNVVKLPDTVRDEQGALLEPSAVAVNAIDAAGVVVGSTVLITGAGPARALVALAARSAGSSKIFVYEPNGSRRARLAEFDGVSVYGESPADLVEAIQEQTECRGGVDAPIECAGLQGALDLCIEATRRTGTIAQVGLFVDRPKID